MRWWVFAYWYEPGVRHDPVGLVRIWELAEHLVSRGDGVTVFTPNYASARRPRSSNVRAIPVLPIRGLRQLSYALASTCVALWAGLRRRPDVVYYRWMDSVHPLLVAKALGAGCVCEVNGEPIPEWGRPGMGVITRMREWVARRTLRRCDRVVVLTEGLRRLVVDRYGVSAEAVAVLPSATDATRFAPQDPREARLRLGLDPRAEYVGFVGSFYRYQGLSCLVRAFTAVLARRPQVRLLLVGDGEVAQELRQEAERLGAGSASVWPGRVPYEDVPAWIGAMTVCVAPFRADRGETSPVKLFDYLACGRPTVASDIPSVSRVFSEREGVLRVPPDDPVALAEAIESLLAQPDRAAELGQRGRAFVREQHSWAGMVERLRGWVQRPPAEPTHANSCILR